MTVLPYPLGRLRLRPQHVRQMAYLLVITGCAGSDTSTVSPPSMFRDTRVLIVGRVTDANANPVVGGRARVALYQTLPDTPVSADTCLGPPSVSRDTLTATSGEFVVEFSIPTPGFTACALVTAAPPAGLPAAPARRIVNGLVLRDAAGGLPRDTLRVQLTLPLVR